MTCNPVTAITGYGFMCAYAMIQYKAIDGDKVEK
jgi:hypothetical protein